MSADHTIFDLCSNNGTGYVLRVGHFNDDNNADLLCDDTINGDFDCRFYFYFTSLDKYTKTGFQKEERKLD